MAIRNIYTGRGNRSNVEGVNANFKYLFDEVEGVWRFLDDKGVEVISSEGIQTAIDEWLANNDFKPKEAVDTFSDLPSDAELKELRGVIDENAVYVFDGTNWLKQSNINFDGLSDVKNDVEDTKNKLDETVKEMYLYKNKVVDIYINGDSTANGDGTKDSPYNNLDSAITELKSKSDKAIEGTYNIRISGTINKGHKIYNLPNFREPVNFIGETDSNGEPITVFDGANATTKTGLWFEPSDNLYVIVKDIIFKNYKKNEGAEEGVIGYGVLMKDKGRLKVENCQFFNNYIGVGGINQNRTTVAKSHFENNDTGVVTQYNSTLTVGSTNDSRNTWNTFKGNNYAVKVSRNSVAHVDYNTIDGSTTAGILVDMASRCNVYGNDITNNKVGVLMQGASEWISNDNNFLNNEVNFQHYGASRETRMHSNTSNMYYDYLPYSPTKKDYVISGTTENFLITVPSSYKLTGDQLTGVGKRFKIRVIGKVRKTTTEKLRLTLKVINTSDALSGESLGYIDFDGNTSFEAFDYTLESTNIDLNTQVIINKLVSSNSPTKLLLSTTNKKFNQDKSIRLYATSDLGNSTVTVDFIQISVAG